MSPARLQRVLRVLTLALAGVGVLYLWNRYELIDLPEGGCSPLRRLRAGNTLWVDLKPAHIAVGDVLFFELPGGEIGLAEVERSRDGEAWWVACDDPACPGTDSEELGWIPRERVHGRLLMAFDF